MFEVESAENSFLISPVVVECLHQEVDDVKAEVLKDE
jgi:hypothetical protein